MEGKGGFVMEVYNEEEVESRRRGTDEGLKVMTSCRGMVTGEEPAFTGELGGSGAGGHREAKKDLCGRYVEEEQQKCVSGRGGGGGTRRKGLC